MSNASRIDILSSNADRLVTHSDIALSEIGASRYQPTKDDRTDTTTFNGRLTGVDGDKNLSPTCEMQDALGMPTFSEKVQLVTVNKTKPDKNPKRMAKSQFGVNKVKININSLKDENEISLASSVASDASDHSMRVDSVDNMKRTKSDFSDLIARECKSNSEMF